MASPFLAFESLAGWREVRVTVNGKRADRAHLIRDLPDGRYGGRRRSCR
ncbi:MAG TPA: hypothetical protein VF170_10265 [Planctomycetaceae bacterium]